MKYTPSCFFPIILLLFVFSGCKKDDSSEKAKFSLKFSDKALQYVKLTEGKYLIYKDSATSLLDSVIVTTSRLKTTFVPSYESNSIIVPDHNEDEFDLVLTKFVGSTQTAWFTGHVYPPFVFPFASTDTAAVDMREPDNGPVFFATESTQSNQTMIVEGRTFNNVLVRANDFGRSVNDPNYKKTIYYWAKGVGIIKRSLITSGGATKTYTLLRNN
jgi:hypothetical protein